MDQLTSNSDAAIASLLEQAKQYAAEGEEYERLARQSYLAARNAIVEAKTLALPSNLSNRKVAERIGRSPNWVDKLMDEEWVATDGGTPFAGARDVGQAVRKALREQPELIVAEALKNPTLADRIIRDLKLGRAAQRPKPDKIPPRPKTSVLFPLKDFVEMGEHVLFVGSADNSVFKGPVMQHLGMPEDGVRIRPDQFAVEMDIVIVSDPPYGKNYPGFDDRNADWREVYKLWKPRGGFSFCAYEPPLFRAAEDGIIAAGGKPVHYLAMQTSVAWGQGPGGRLPNVLQAIIYWERRGEKPWPKGRRAASSVLRANEEAQEEMREARKLHTTPKPVNVMEDLIDLVTDKGDFVLDPFTGSGSTLVACENTGRKFIGFEKLAPYVEVAVERWQQTPGNKGKAIVHRWNANPSSMLFDDLKARGRWDDRPGTTG